MTIGTDETGDKPTAPREEGTAAASEARAEKTPEAKNAEPGVPEKLAEAKPEAEMPAGATSDDGKADGGKSDDARPEPAKLPEPAKAEAPKEPAAPLRAPEISVEAKPQPEEKASDDKAAASFFRRRAATANSALQPAAPPAPPPKKKKRRDGTLSAMSGFLSFLLVGLVAGVFGVIAVIHKLREPGPLAAEKVVYLPPRSDVPEMVAQLEREGVIDSPGLMKLDLFIENLHAKLRKADFAVKPGEYLFKKNASLREVIDELVAGKQLMHSVTIPEGLTSEQIVERLRESDLLTGDVPQTPKEGDLLPETYKFPRGFPRDKLISKMRADQRKLVEQIWARRSRDIPLKSPYELVTLASIVEKETGKAEERPRVAAVFMNRLKKGMRLQSDPTIIYGLVGGKATLGRGIMRSEIEKWTPYNTYAIDGLPPGPIANPGKAALEATANPANTRDLYFVADGTGGHVFAESLDQHSRNVQNWRRIEQDQKAKPGAAPAGTDQSAPAAVPPAAPKSDKRTEAPIGRLVTLAAPQDDYPAGRAMKDDDGATHRLGKYGPAGAAFFLGGLEDPTAEAAPHLRKLRVARPYFTEDAAQPRNAVGGFDPDLLAAAPAPAGEGEEGAIGPDMMARESADGKALPEDMAEIAAYPVSPARRAEQKARAAKLGLSTGSDELPADALGEKVSADEPAAAAPVAGPIAMAPAQPRARPRAFDASEGTALDPLKDKSWDLTSAKTVPSSGGVR